MFQTAIGLQVFQLGSVEGKKTRLLLLVAKQKGALETNVTKLVFVQDHSIHDHSVARRGVMDSDGNSHFDPCSLASVVVVVVVVSETCPHANGATNAKAILNTILFMFSPC